MKEMNEHGIKFTMDNLARRLAVSKRTLYEYFPSKENLIGSILTAIFSDVKEKRQAIMKQPELSFEEKLRQMLTVRSSLFAETTDRVAIEIKKHMPQQWANAEECFESLWKEIEELIQQGQAAGCFRPVFFPALQAMFKGAFHEIANYQFLLENKVTIHEMIDFMTDILVFGLAVTKDHATPPNK